MRADLLQSSMARALRSVQVINRQIICGAPPLGLGHGEAGEREILANSKEDLILFAAVNEKLGEIPPPPISSRERDQRD